MATSAAAPATTTSSKRSAPERARWLRAARRVRPPSSLKNSDVRETAMNATGIGAAVRRKEDFRFVTGNGQYTDDVTRPGVTRAVFVRSPHAHAKVRGFDISVAWKNTGVARGPTGAELSGDKIGNLICGWMIHSKDGSPMKMAPHPALASRTGNYVLRSVPV